MADARPALEADAITAPATAEVRWPTSCAKTGNRTSFHLDVERLVRLGSFEATLLAGYDGGGERLFVLDLRAARGTFAVRARARDDTRAWHATEWVPLSDPLDIVELVWWRSLPGLQNGRLQLFVDGLAPVGIEGLDMESSSLVALGEARLRDGRVVVMEVAEQ